VALLSQELLNRTVTQREPEIEPGCVADDLGWDLITCMGDGLLSAPADGVGIKAHQNGLQRQAPSRSEDVIFSFYQPTFLSLGGTRGTGGTRRRNDGSGWNGKGEQREQQLVREAPVPPTCSPSRCRISLVVPPVPPVLLQKDNPHSKRKTFPALVTSIRG
jgi:hypothetical protein